MKFSEEIQLIEFGYQVAIVDNEDVDAKPLAEAFDSLNVGNHYYRVDPTEPQFPEHTQKDVKLVFLDLYYDDSFGSKFEADVCVDWLERIIPHGQPYTLVVWSKDVELTSELRITMVKRNLTMPVKIIKKAKADYLIGNVHDNIERMLSELGIRLKDIDQHEYYGKVIQLEADSVLIMCLIDEKTTEFEVRRFDLQPFANHISLEIGKFLKIKVTTKPGSRTIDFFEETQNLSLMFIKPDVELDTETQRMDWLNI